MSTLQSVIERPVLLGASWYAYSREDRAPWGVAQRDLLTGPLAASLLLAKEIVCDDKAFNQEMRARDQLNWVSPEILGRLKDEGIVTTRSFQTNVSQALSDSAVSKKLSSLLSPRSTDPALPSLRQVDRLLTDGLANAEVQPMNVFFGGNSDQGFLFPTAAAPALLEVFLGEDFYILPPPAKWPNDVKDAAKEIDALQAPHLEKLARLEYSGSEYIERIKDAHSHLDATVDTYLRNHTHPKYGTLEQRLKYLFKVRKGFHDSRVLEMVAGHWARRQGGKITNEEFVASTSDALRKASDELIAAKRSAVTSALGAIALSVGGALTYHLDPDLARTFGFSLGGAAEIALLVKAIQSALKANDNRGLAYLKFGS